MESESQSSAETEQRLPRRAIFPWIVGLLTLGLLALLHFGGDLVADAVNDSGVANVLKFVLPLVAVFMISLWYLIRRFGSSGLGMLLAVIGLLCPIGFLFLFQPVFGGNADVL